ncbi:hypothetical protein FE783_14675 [Paenibacillus mesophilus]|uniref:hypothetical protein n=1 Tax=Paenibacillus mesophilus TaxID=2582849 RepID=UPI00110F3ADA|nr:hypothetical protein [Paenibacillus mesophilus]TMV48916.1 hypothetical protein FE783_14675 [Paenibacillus mesophilus]
MRWSGMIAVTVIIGLIFLYEWPKMKRSPKKDKAVFVTLLSVCWVLSLFDLRSMAGPTTLIESLFKPFSEMLEK